MTDSPAASPGCQALLGFDLYNADPSSLKLSGPAESSTPLIPSNLQLLTIGLYPARSPFITCPTSSDSAVGEFVSWIMDTYAYTPPADR